MTLDTKKLEKEILDLALKEIEDKVRSALAHRRFKLVKKGEKITIENITEDEREKIQEFFK